MSNEVPGSIVNVAGEIRLHDGGRIWRGSVLVTKDQAEQAKKYGWKIVVGSKHAKGDLVEVER